MYKTFKPKPALNCKNYSMVVQNKVQSSSDVLAPFSIQSSCLV